MALNVPLPREPRATSAAVSESAQRISAKGKPAGSILGGVIILLISRLELRDSSMPAIRTERCSPKPLSVKFKPFRDRPPHSVRHSTHILLTNPPCSIKSSTRRPHPDYPREPLQPLYIHPKTYLRPRATLYSPPPHARAKMACRLYVLVARVKSQHDFTKADQIPHSHSSI